MIFEELKLTNKLAYGRDIGKIKNPSHLYKRVVCPDCNLHRWVEIGNLRRRKTDLCLSCTRAKHKFGDMKGKNNPNWKGGWMSSGGYKMIWLSPDDYFASMGMNINNAPNGVYVLEHRLVMAKHLGRCLQPWEIVHHKNGIRDDNRIENLELHSDLGHKGITFVELKIKKLEENILILKTENESLRLQLARALGKMVYYKLEDIP